MIKYYLDSATGIMHASFSDDITFEELLDHVTPKEERKHYPKKLKILSNAKNATFSFKTAELEHIKNQITDTLSKYDKIYDAFVVNRPLETALSMMYMELARLENYEFKVFSTVEAANFWLSRK